MPMIITKVEASRFKSCSKSAISMAIKRGKLVVNSDGKIDMNDPVNRLYFTKPREPSAATARADVKRKEEAAERRKKRQDPDRPIEVEISKAGVTIAEQNPFVFGDNGQEFDPAQKIYEDTRLKKIQADLKNLELAERVSVTIDIESLQRKFGRFRHFMINDLIQLPESVADMIVKRVLAAVASGDDPRIAVVEELKDSVADIVKTAKAASRDVMPPPAGVKYTFVEIDGNMTVNDAEQD